MLLDTMQLEQSTLLRYLSSQSQLFATHIDHLVLTNNNVPNKPYTRRCCVHSITRNTGTSPAQPQLDANVVLMQPPTHDRAGTKRFDQLPQLSPETLDVLHALGFTSCTPVQDAVIPLFCGNKVQRWQATINATTAPRMWQWMQPPALARHWPFSYPS